MGEKQRILFSRRREISKEALQVLIDEGLPRTPFNIICALEILGYLKEKEDKNDGQSST